MVAKRIVKPNEPDVPDGRKEEIWEAIRTLVLGQVDASQVLELFYWSRDPDILKMLQTIVCLPEEHRRTICSFFANSDVKSISINVDAAGRVILSSQKIADRS